MNRREFNASIATALVSAIPLKAESKPGVLHAGDTPFDISVMLWTVYRDLPFEERLEKVAAAGYRNVELVAEYANWSDADFARANAKRKELGITFDCVAGLKHGLANPAERDDLLADLRSAIPVMERLDCPAIILLSGNIVPGLSMELQQQSCVDGLRAAAQVVEGKKINGQPVRLLLENIDPEENPKY